MVLARTHPLGYLSTVPTVLRRAGFRVVIYLPPREHAPPHVHVQSANGEVVIALAAERRPQTIRTVAGMRTPEVIRAFRLVEDHAAFLLTKWREYHG